MTHLFIYFFLLFYSYCHNQVQADDYIPEHEIQMEMEEIELRLDELERRGVELEQKLRRMEDGKKRDECWKLLLKKDTNI